jgi:hypothetical protein
MFLGLRAKYRIEPQTREKRLQHETAPACAMQG